MGLKLLKIEIRQNGNLEKVSSQAVGSGQSSGRQAEEGIKRKAKIDDRCKGEV